ncbi:hypothetical protein MTO96_024571 [Rhipicephalus appendiculatus]
MSTARVKLITCIVIVVTEEEEENGHSENCSAMENYTKGESTEESVGPPPFKDLRDDFVHMKVQPNSKLRNLLEYAKKAFQDEAKRQMVFTGSGHALAKTITCVEIMKRKHKAMNKILYKKVEDCWEPKSPEFDRIEDCPRNTDNSHTSEQGSSRCDAARVPGTWLH